jgi:hypothetical protein
MNRDRLYPIVLTADELPPVADQEGLATPLGHDLYVSLVEEHGGRRLPVRLVDLSQLMLDAYGGHVVAVDNLERVAKSRGLNATLYRTKSEQPFVAWHGSWLAASCCQLPYLYKLVRRQLGADHLCLSIPHRGALLLFPQGDQASRDEMRSVIQKHEGQANEQLTFDLFSLHADGVSAFYEEE